VALNIGNVGLKQYNQQRIRKLMTMQNNQTDFKNSLY